MAGSPRVKEFLDLIWKTHQQKNGDYAKSGHIEGGDVFSNFRTSERLGIDPLGGVLVRLNDKHERMCNLYAKGFNNSVPNEGFKDALLDMAGYCAIAAAMYEEQLEQERQNECPFCVEDGEPCKICSGDANP